MIGWLNYKERERKKRRKKKQPHPTQYYWDLDRNSIYWISNCFSEIFFALSSEY